MQKTLANSEVKSYNKLGLMSKPNKNKMSVKLGRNKYTYGFIDVTSAKGGGICAVNYIADSTTLPAIEALKGDIAWVPDKLCFMEYDGYDWVDSQDYNDVLETALFRYNGTLYYYKDGTLVSLSGNEDIADLKLKVEELESRVTTVEGDVVDINTWIGDHDLGYIVIT